MWQNLSDFGIGENTASSMVNNRSGASLLASGSDGAGAHYCARPFSEDSNFGNNGSINDNGESIYLSTAANYHAGWACFNPY